MKVGVIGAVGSTKVTLIKLIEHQFDVIGVLGHEPINSKRVSGLQDLNNFCKENQIDYKGFQRINEDSTIEWMSSKSPEIIFAVGFSQLLDNRWLNMTNYGCVGFHPTRLPKGRGRAPVAWLILERQHGAATFFRMAEGADNGPIYVQEKFEITDEDDAESVVPKVHNSIRIALDRWLPKLKNRIVEAYEQDESQATEYGKRDPADGQIQWEKSAESIDRLIKASCRPHPGAFTFFESHMLKIWKSRVDETQKIQGVIGRVLKVNSDGVLVQAGNGCILITEYSSENNIELKVGNTLEFNSYIRRRELNKLILST